MPIHVETFTAGSPFLSHVTSIAKIIRELALDLPANSIFCRFKVFLPRHSSLADYRRHSASPEALAISPLTGFHPSPL